VSSCLGEGSVAAAVSLVQVSDAGRAHAGNGDALGHWEVPDGIVFAIADGIGRTGREASTLALERIGARLREASADLPPTTRLRRAVQDANVALYEKAVTVPELSGMATTVTVSGLVGTALVAAHVGDCRLSLLRDGTLTQLTKDHTWAWAHLPGAGVAAAEDGRRRRYASPRCLGRELVVSIDLLSMQLRPGDVLVHTTDGIHGPLAAEELGELLRAHPPDAAARALVRRAREEDATGDASVQIALVTALPEPAPRSWWPFAR
jgi:serine/threonine protein phosphatase PrpC